MVRRADMVVSAKKIAASDFATHETDGGESYSISNSVRLGHIRFAAISISLILVHLLFGHVTRRDGLLAGSGDGLHGAHHHARGGGDALRHRIHHLVGALPDGLHDLLGLGAGAL